MGKCRPRGIELCTMALQLDTRWRSLWTRTRTRRSPRFRSLQVASLSMLHALQVIRLCCSPPLPPCKNALASGTLDSTKCNHLRVMSSQGLRTALQQWDVVNRIDLYAGHCTG